MVQRKAAGRRGQHLVAGFVSHKCWAVGAGRGLASCPDEIHLALRLATWGSACVSVYRRCSRVFAAKGPACNRFVNAHANEPARARDGTCSRVSAMPASLRHSARPAIGRLQRVVPWAEHVSHSISSSCIWYMPPTFVCTHQCMGMLLHLARPQQQAAQDKHAC